MTICVYDKLGNVLNTPVNVQAKNNDSEAISLRFTFQKTITGCTNLATVTLERRNPLDQIVGYFTIVFYVEGYSFFSDVTKTDHLCNLFSPSDFKLQRDLQVNYNTMDR